MSGLFSDPRVVEASLAAVPPSVTIGCTCRWDEYGNPPPSCTCAERSRQHAMDRRRAALTAAVAALPREEMIEKAARAIYARDTSKLSPGSVWDDERPACRAAFRDRARVALVAIGLIAEHVTPEASAPEAERD